MTYPAPQSSSQVAGFGGSGFTPLRMSQRSVVRAPVSSAHSMFLDGIRKETTAAPAAPDAASAVQSTITAVRTSRS
jgi:hypothetical protein